MTIKRFFIISFGVIIAASFIVSTIILFTSARLRWQNERIQFSQNQLLLLKNISNNLNRVLKEASDYVLFEESKDFEEFLAHKDKLETLFVQYETISKSEIKFADENEKDDEYLELKTIDQLKRDIDLLVDTAIEISSASKGGDKKSALDQLEGSIEKTHDEGFAEKLEDQIKDEEQEIQKVNQQFMSLIDRLQYVVISTLIIMIVVIGAMAILVLRGIYLPIESLIQDIGVRAKELKSQYYLKN